MQSVSYLPSWCAVQWTGQGRLGGQADAVKGAHRPFASLNSIIGVDWSQKASSSMRQSAAGRNGLGLKGAPGSASGTHRVLVDSVMEDESKAN